jgi:DNA-binding NtrC family response regulator
MQTSWFLLVRSGGLEARLLQGTPPRFAGGAYKVKEVELDNGVLPEIRPPAALSDTHRHRRAYAPQFADVGQGSGRAGAGRSAGGTAQTAGKSRGHSGAAGTGSSGGELVADDPAFQELLERAGRAALYEVSVLIEGETGSGKGVLAKNVHAQSARAAGHFVSVNCSAISASLAESELFGHVKGSFTGAVSDRLGQFRAAAGGTVFLDEIGDLPLELQPKLLRALEEKRVTPVGADQEYEVDVRVIAATNKDLPAMIQEGSFRRDLYERINQVRLSVPPLRSRPQDIRTLAQRFLIAWNRRYHEERVLTEEVLQAFEAYHWPGNVRELANAVQAMCATAVGKELTVDVLPPEIRGSAPAGATGGIEAVRIPEEGLQLKSLLSQVEHAYYKKALERTGGNRERAAALLGLNPPAFRKALRERFGEE